MISEAVQIQIVIAIPVLVATITGFVLALRKVSVIQAGQQVIQQKQDDTHRVVNGNLEAAHARIELLTQQLVTASLEPARLRELWQQLQRKDDAP